MALDPTLEVTQNNVQAAYLAYFARPADTAGLAFWMTGANIPGTTMVTIMEDFSKSAEFHALYPESSTNVASFVNQVYNNLFNRDAEPAGLNFWVNAIATGATTIGFAVYEIARGAQGDDATILGNKVAYANAFVDALLNDTEANAAYDADTIPYVRDQVATVGLSAASLAAANDNLPDVMTALVAGPEVNWTLTTGIDSFVGTNANDTFIAPDGTIGPFDTISGDGGYDTLKILNESTSIGLFGPQFTGLEHVNIQNANGALATVDLAATGAGLTDLTVDYRLNAATASLDVYDVDAATNITIKDAIDANVDFFAGASDTAMTSAHVFGLVDSSVDFHYEELTATTLDINLHVSGVEGSDVDVNVDDTGDNEDLTSITRNIKVENASDSWIYVETYNSSPDVEYVSNVSISNVSYSGVELYDYHGGNSNNTLNVTISDSDGAEFEFYTYDDVNSEQSSGLTDTLNITFDNVTSDDEDSSVYAYDLDFVNIVVNGDTALDDFDIYSYGDGDYPPNQVISIIANADLTIDDFDVTDGGTAEFTIMGAGNVTFETHGDNYGLTVDASELTGDLTLGAYTDSGEGGAHIIAGSGDDLIRIEVQELNADGDAQNSDYDGGAGIDTIEIWAAGAIASEANLTADVEEFDIVHFEKLSLTSVGAGAVDATLWNLGDYVVLDGGNGFTVTVNDGATVELTGDFPNLTVDVDGAGAAGSDNDSATLMLNDTDGLTGTVVVDDVETISVQSTASDPDTGDNVLTLDAAAAETLNVSGDMALEVTVASTLTALAMVDAAAFDAGLTIDVSSSGEDVTITTGDGADVVTGSDQDDTISVGNGGNTVTGGDGLDHITLGDGVTEDDFDTIVYDFASESQGVTVDVIHGFQVDVQSTDDINTDDVVDEDDVINDVLDFSGVVMVGGSYLGEANGYGAVLTSLSGGGDAEAVLDISTSTLYVDVDGSGTLDDSDFAIQLAGVTDLSDANFMF